MVGSCSRPQVAGVAGIVRVGGRAEAGYHQVTRTRPPRYPCWLAIGAALLLAAAAAIGEAMAPPPAFPWPPVLALSFIAFASCFSITYIFPIVPYLILDLGMVEDAREPGLYAGYLNSAAILGSTLSGIPWGVFSDRFGRQLPLRISMLSVAVISVAFGASDDFWWSVALRLCQGLMNSTFIVSKVAISEVCHPDHTARAMGMVFSMWGGALIAGPAAAGLLSHPERLYPSLFAPTSVFVRQPYLLPTVVSAAMCSLGFLATWLVPSVSEDDAGKQQASEAEDAEEERVPLVGDSQRGAEEDRSEAFCSVFCSRDAGSRAVRLCIALDLLRGFYVLGDDNMFPLFAAAPRAAGGLDCKSLGLRS